MSSKPLAIRRTGLVSSVGLSARASCAAFRAKLTNPVTTRFVDANGEWILGHEVPMEQPWRGLEKLARMAALSIEEALHAMPQAERGTVPMLLCVAEAGRPGRMQGLDDELFARIEREVGHRFPARSAVLSHGRTGVAVALAHARTLVHEEGLPQVLIVAADGLLNWPTLKHFDLAGRLLSPKQSDGFMPGEAAGALLVGPRAGVPGELLCTGVGFGVEAAHIGSGEALRAEGLTRAIRAALDDAGCQMHHMDFRIADLSGEQYYFKEAALTLSRILRVRKKEFDLWHPAECIGETGAAAGAAIVACAWASANKGYACGPNMLAHMSDDGGQRAALCLQQVVPA